MSKATDRLLEAQLAEAHAKLETTLARAAQINELVEENKTLRAEVDACHKLLDTRGLCIGSEFHGDLLRRVEWLADANRQGPQLRAEVERLRGEVAEATRALELVPRALDSLMSEYVSKRGACDWGLVNDCLISAEDFLRGRAALEEEG